MYHRQIITRQKQAWRKITENNEPNTDHFVTSGTSRWWLLRITCSHLLLRNEVISYNYALWRRPSRESLSNVFNKCRNTTQKSWVRLASNAVKKWMLAITWWIPENFGWNSDCLLFNGTCSLQSQTEFYVSFSKILD